MIVANEFIWKTVKRNKNAYIFFVQEQWAEINKTRTSKMTKSMFGNISKVISCINCGLKFPTVIT